MSSIVVGHPRVNPRFFRAQRHYTNIPVMSSNMSLTGIDLGEDDNTPFHQPLRLDLIDPIHRMIIASIKKKFKGGFLTS